MAAPFFFRALAELFPGTPNGVASTQQATHRAPAATSKPDVPREVGHGADNETFVTIDGMPNLFVDEGDCVVQFRPAFEEAPRDTRFGTKILPELSPHWSVVHQHVPPLRDAIATAIRSKSTRHARSVADDGAHASPAQGQGQAPYFAAHDAPAQPELDRRRRTSETTRTRGTPGTAGRGDLAGTMGRIVSWGEEDFPNRKPYGKPFYTSFAIHIQTSQGEQVLQGEGLKDAIAESHCNVGDFVSVRRLRKVKVPAFRESGQPVIKNGQQVYWDKWLWSITLK